MAYTAVVPVPLATSQTGLVSTLRAALMDTTGTIHATLRDISTGFVLISGSHYLWSSSSIPDSYAGVVVFYTGTLGAGTDFSGVTHKGDGLLSPPETENADVKTSTRSALTAAQIATGVWQDSTAGDFTTASSIGKSLYNAFTAGTSVYTVAALANAPGGGGGGGTVTGYAAGQDPATLVLDVLSSSHIVSGSIGYLISLLGTGGVITTVAVVTAGGTVTITKGDDCYLADGRQIDFTGASSNLWPDLTGATVKLNVNDANLCTGSVVTPTGTQKVRFQPTATQTGGLSEGVYDYDVKATLSSGHVVTLVRGSRQFVVNDTEAS